MELGTGVFLSAVFIGFIILFIFTKDRWNWKKIILVLIGAPILLGLVIGGGVASYKFYKKTFPPTVIKQTGLEELELGMTKNEVRYIKGEPNQVLEKVSDDINFYWYVDPIPTDKNIVDYNMWEYSNDYGNELTVTFNPKAEKVNSLSCRQGKYNYRDACEIQGLLIGLTEEEIINRLDRPIKEKLNGSIKILYYPDINLKFYLEKKKVYMIEISEEADI